MAAAEQSRIVCKRGINLKKRMAAAEQSRIVCKRGGVVVDC